MDITIDKYEWMSIVGIIEGTINEAIAEPSSPPDAEDCASDILSELGIDRKD